MFTSIQPDRFNDMLVRINNQFIIMFFTYFVYYATFYPTNYFLRYAC